MLYCNGYLPVKRHMALSIANVDFRVALYCMHFAVRFLCEQTPLIAFSSSAPRRSEMIKIGTVIQKKRSA